MVGEADGETDGSGEREGGGGGVEESVATCGTPSLSLQAPRTCIPHRRPREHTYVLRWYLYGLRWSGFIPVYLWFSSPCLPCDQSGVNSLLPSIWPGEGQEFSSRHPYQDTEGRQTSSPGDSKRRE